MTGTFILEELLNRYSNMGVQMETLRRFGRTELSRAVSPSFVRQQAQRRLKPNEVAELVEAYQRGEATNGLALRFGIHRATVLTHLKRAGVEILQQCGLQVEQIEEAARLYVQGWSLARLGERLHVSGETVRSALTKAGVSMRPRPGRS